MFNIHKFNSVEEFNAVYKGDGYSEPWVSHTDGSGVNYNKSEEDKELEKLSIPLTFEIQGSGIIRWVAGNIRYSKTIEYSKNGGEWISITSAQGTNTPNISVVSGDMVQFRGDNAYYGGYLNDNGFTNSFQGTTCQFKIKGNIMSLIDSANFATLKSFPEEEITDTQITKIYQLAELFEYCSGLTDASELLLPATTLKQYCYYSLFLGCSGLISPPKLSATTLEKNCYNNMFSSCTNLTTAPELPAVTLVENCYRRMFRGCSNLSSIKCLATDISATDALYNWLENASSTGAFYKAAGVTYPSGVSGIPSGWTVVEV